MAETTRKLTWLEVMAVLRAHLTDSRSRIVVVDGQYAIVCDDGPARLRVEDGIRR